MPRQPARVHKPFYRLNRKANFFIGAGLYEKTSFCTARAIGADVPGVKFIAPWTVVRSDEFVNKKLSLPAGVKLKVRNDCITHYVGDDCPGGHSEPVTQPNSDNNVSGPTS